MQPANCLNCAETIDVHHHFCHHCGQKTALHRLTLKEVGHDALHYFTHADKGIFKLLKEMALRPGTAAREYVAGKRKSYFPPLNFYLIVAALVLLATGISQKISADNQSPSRQPTAQAQQTPSLQREAPDPVTIKRLTNIGRFFAKYGNLVPICAMPLISFILWIMYARGPYNFTEHFVANMYIGSFTLLFYIVFVMFLPRDVSRTGLYIYFAFEIVYRSIAYYHFINQRTRLSAVKALLTNALVVVGWGWLTGTLISQYLKNGLWGLLE